MVHLCEFISGVMTDEWKMNIIIGFSRDENDFVLHDGRVTLMDCRSYLLGEGNIRQLASIYLIILSNHYNVHKLHSITDIQIALYLVDGSF